MKYEIMKPSGAAWLGDIPSTWDCKKIGSLFKQRNTKVSDKDYPALSVSKAGVTPQLETAVKTDNGDNRKLVKTGDFVVNSRSDRKGSCGVSHLDGSVSLINIVLTPRQEWNRKYVHYLMRSQTFSEEYYHYGRGIVADLWTTRFSEMKNICIPVPPREEQDQIVRYLDWQVSKINKLIAAKKKEIALIDERQRSLTYNLVTNGVYGNKRAKSSGINWIEIIPSEWKVLYLSQVANERTVKNTGMIEDNLLSLSYGHIIKKDINSTDGLLPTSFEGYQIVEPGNIVLRLTDLQNDHKSLRVGLATQKGIITSAYTCLNVHDNILPEYLYLQLHAADLCKVFYGMGGGVRQSIGFKEIRKMLIAVPPISEQEKIVLAEMESSATTDTLINNLKEEIEKLEELKKRLISDVVTGQIDVRGVEIPDYEYAEELIDDVTDDAEESPEVDEYD